MIQLVLEHVDLLVNVLRQLLRLLRVQWRAQQACGLVLHVGDGLFELMQVIDDVSAVLWLVRKQNGGTSDVIVSIRKSAFNDMMS